MRFRDCHDECEGCDACDPLVDTGQGLEPASEVYTEEGLSVLREARLVNQARDLRREELTQGMTFEELSELYLTLTDGIVRERLARKTAERKLHEIKRVIHGE